MIRQSPFEFNTLKHHRDSIHAFLGEISLVSLQLALKRIGESQMDLYYGMLSVTAIENEIKDRLLEENHFSLDEYKRWIAGNNSYATVQLSDTSQWVLREGVDPQRYIHIHPARYSPHTVRANANTLKTVIACGVWLREGIIHQPDRASINKVRVELLGLSPIGALPANGSIKKIMTLLIQ